MKDIEQVYHNVFSFNSRIRVKATTKNPAILRKNLDACFLSKAENWYREELSHIERVGVQSDTNRVEECCKLLENRFREAPDKSLTALKTTRYGIQDVRSQKDPTDSVQYIILHGRNAGIAVGEAEQAWLILCAPRCYPTLDHARTNG